MEEWIDPKKAQVEQEFREKTREQDKRRKAAQKASQDYCPHLAGSMGDWNSWKTSIVWHTQRGEALSQGICTICLRIFLPTDSDYKLWRAKPSYNRESSAGVEAPLTDEDRAIIKKHGLEGWGVVEKVVETVVVGYKTKPTDDPWSYD